MSRTDELVLWLVAITAFLFGWCAGAIYMASRKIDEDEQDEKDNPP